MTEKDYRIAGNFRWCTFSYELPILIFRSLNIRTAQDSDVEHVVQGNFRMMLYNTKIRNFHYTKITRYTIYLSENQ